MTTLSLTAAFLGIASAEVTAVAFL